MLITLSRSGQRCLLLALMLSAGLSGQLHAATTDAGPPAGSGQPGHQPPAQAYTDCKGKQEGDTVQISTPDGQKLKASCVKSEQGLFARPEHPPMPPMPHDGGPHDGGPHGEYGMHGHPPPPPPPAPPAQAYTDCKGKQEGDTVQISTPDGQKLKASCVKSEQGLFARPEHPPMPPMPPMPHDGGPHDGGPHDGGPYGAHGMHGHPPPPPPPTQAYTDCKGKQEGDTVQISTPDGQKLKASCVKSEQGLFARPEHPPMPPAPAAKPALPAN